MFKLWSETNSEAKKELKPDLGFRKWAVFSSDEKARVWKFLEKYFFDKDVKKDFNHAYSDPAGNYYDFFGEGEYEQWRNEDEQAKRLRILKVIGFLNDKYKFQSYARNFLEKSSFTSACSDFYKIFSTQSENVVVELLSLYAKAVIVEKEDKNLNIKKDESNEAFEKRNNEWKWEDFDKFAEDLNDVFQHFGMHILLTKQGFIPRQSEKITKDIYLPVLEVLVADEYHEVSEMLKKAFANFQEKHYDKVITNAINAIHAYLQLRIHNKIGNGNLKTLLTEAQKQKMIPSDKLPNDLYGNIESFLARIRQEKTDSHPSVEKATEGDALFVLNLTMVVLQNFVNYKK